MLNNKVFSSPLLHYKTGANVVADRGITPEDTGVAATTVPTSGSWQSLGEFDPSAYARLGAQGISSVVTKLRIRQGYRNSSGTFVPLSVSSEITLTTSSAPGDALSCEVVGSWAELQAFNSNADATVDYLVTGRMVS